MRIESGILPQEIHGTEVDYDVFRNVQPPDPSRPHGVYRAEGVDFRLKENSAAVDAGVRLPGVKQ